MSPLVPSSRVLIIGKPNSGKTLLFNRLTGLRQKVANFPGVTVEVKRAVVNGVEVVDLPGLYSLSAISPDESVAVAQFRQAIAHVTPTTLLCILDATRLERSLVLGLEVGAAARQAQIPCLFALNMIDELKAVGLTIDVAALSQAIGHEVVAVSARTREGLDVLQAKIAATVPLRRTASFTSAADVPLLHDYPAQARSLADRFAPASAPLMAKQLRIDRYLLHGLTGFFAFFVTMALLFQAVFTWASPLMDGTTVILEFIGTTVARWMPTPLLGDFVKDGLLGGISAVIVFVPQIALLTFLIGILEDSGYLTRAAMLCHRPLSRIGMSGKSFVPLLSGHACAIPAIMAARTIESPRARWLTWIAIPLMSCSARLPVYGLIIMAIIPDQTYLGGVLGLRGLTMLGLYGFGIASGLGVAAMTNRFASKKSVKALPFILEMPPYRLPTWRPLVLRSFNAAWAFTKRAGWIIFVVSLLVWFLGYFPGGAGHLEASYLATIGHVIEPLFAPLGLNWKFAVAVLTSFLAREVFVGTLGVLFGIEDASADITGMATQAQNAGLTLASGLALLAFFAISLQCVSTLAVLRKESGSRRLPFVLLICYSAAAYLVAFAIYRLAVSW